MTSRNENNMGAPESLPTTPVPCGDYQARDEKGMLVPLPEYVAIVCKRCLGDGGYAVPSRNEHGSFRATRVTCSACEGEGSVLIDKSKLKVIS